MAEGRRVTETQLHAYAHDIQEALEHVRREHGHFDYVIGVSVPHPDDPNVGATFAMSSRMGGLEEAQWAVRMIAKIGQEFLALASKLEGKLKS